MRVPARYHHGVYRGLLFGGILDLSGFQHSAIGQWLVGTISGEGEILLEWLYAFRKRLRGGEYGMAEAYGWGKLIGMTFPWWIDWGSRALGVYVYGVEGFYIPFFYAMSDQMGANISGMLYLRRNSTSWQDALLKYLRQPCDDQWFNSHLPCTHRFVSCAHIGIQPLDTGTHSH